MPIKARYDFNLSDKIYIPAELNGTFNFNINNRSTTTPGNYKQSFDMKPCHPVVSAGFTSGLGYNLNEKMKVEVALDYSVYVTSLRKGSYTKEFGYNSPLEGRNTVWGGLNFRYNF